VSPDRPLDPPPGAGGPAGSVRGRLLVAAPTLADPNFARSVVLILEHDEEGAAGVILNRPVDADLRDHLPEWAPFAAEPSVAFMGGPVGDGGGLALGRGSGGRDLDGWASDLSLRVIDIEVVPDLDDPLRVRIFAGYSGWGAGQLESELSMGGWIVVDMEPDDAFTPDPGRLWSRVLRRQGGDLALLATMPIDPSLN
jgi:putative transcriptional regulator